MGDIFTDYKNSSHLFTLVYVSWLYNCCMLHERTDAIYGFVFNRMLIWAIARVNVVFVFFVQNMFYYSEGIAKTLDEVRVREKE